MEKGKEKEKAKAEKLKPVKKQITMYESVMSKTIENILSTMQMYSSDKHRELFDRAMIASTTKTALRLNLMGITDAEEKAGIEALKNDPIRATQCSMNYGFHFSRHTSCDLGWNLGLSVVLLGMIKPHP